MLIQSSMMKLSGTIQDVFM